MGNLNWTFAWGGRSADVEFRIDPIVAARINDLPENCAEALAQAMGKKARELAPRDTGAMAQKLWVKRRRGGRKDSKEVWSVGTRTKGKVVSKSGRKRGYGAPVEFGHYMRNSNRMATKWVKPKPFLRPARVWVAQNVDMILKAAGVPLQ